MSENFYDKAMRLNRTQSVVTKLSYLTQATGEGDPHHMAVAGTDPKTGESYGVNLHATNLLNIQESHHTEYLTSPTTALSSNLLTGSGRVEFKLSKTTNRLKDKHLEITVTNNGAAAVSFTSFDLIEKIDIRMSGSSCELGSYFSDNTYLIYLSHLDPDQRGVLEMFNMSPTYGVLTPLAAGATQTYYYPIIDILDNVKPVNAYLNNDITMTVQFRGTRLTSLEASSLAINPLYIRESHVQLKPLVEREHMSVYDGVAHFRSLHPYRETLDQVLTANQVVQMKLHGIQGSVSHLFVTIVETPITQATSRTFEPIETLELVGGNGHCEGAVVTGKYNRVIQSSRASFNNHDFFVQKNVYHISFAAAPTMDHHGSQTGFSIFDGKEKVKFTMPAIADFPNSGSTFRITVTALMHSLVEIRQGVMKLHQ